MVPRGEPTLLQHNSSEIALEAKGSPGPDELVKALVRRGADARVALAQVLGVSAGDIRARDCAESAVP